MKIGFIGLGIMGESMSENIIKKHDGKVFVFDINKAQVDKLAAVGGVPCSSSAEVIKNADIVFTMVPKSEHVRSVYDEMLPFIDSTKICVDMSTIDPSVSVEVAADVKAKGGRFADAPVVKSKPAAINGTLGILVGCDEELYPVIEPILKYMGCNVIRMGENGMGITMKICHNALVGEIQNAVNETLGLARKQGIAIEDFVKAVSYGGAQNFYLDSQWQNLAAENWTTAFSLENEHKDLGIAQRLCKASGCNMPGLDNVKAVFDKGMEKGMGKTDFRATYRIVNGEV